eukprot:8846195-Alexandrium_andersonii.AAC.1
MTARHLQPASTVVRPKANRTTISLRPAAVLIAEPPAPREPDGSLVSATRTGRHDAEAPPTVGKLAIGN